MIPRLRALRVLRSATRALVSRSRLIGTATRATLSHLRFARSFATATTPVPGSGSGAGAGTRSGSGAAPKLAVAHSSTAEVKDRDRPKRPAGYVVSAIEEATEAAQAHSGGDHVAAVEQFGKVLQLLDTQATATKAAIATANAAKQKAVVATLQARQQHIKQLTEGTRMLRMLAFQLVAEADLARLPAGMLAAPTRDAWRQWVLNECETIKALGGARGLEARLTRAVLVERALRAAAKAVRTAARTADDAPEDKKLVAAFNTAVADEKRLRQSVTQEVDAAMLLLDAASPNPATATGKPAPALAPPTRKGKDPHALGFAADPARGLAALPGLDLHPDPTPPMLLRRTMLTHRMRLRADAGNVRGAVADALDALSTLLPPADAKKFMLSNSAVQCQMLEALPHTAPDHPANTNAFFLRHMFLSLNMFYLQLDKPQEAIPYGEQALRFRANDHIVISHLGRAYHMLAGRTQFMAQQRYPSPHERAFAEKAVRLFSEALEKHIPASDTKRLEAWTRREAVADTPGAHKHLFAANTGAKAAITLATAAPFVPPPHELPFFVSTLLQRADMWMRLGADTDEGGDAALTLLARAVADLRLCAGLIPHHYENHTKLAMTLIMAGRYDDAIDAATNGVEYFRSKLTRLSQDVRQRDGLSHILCVRASAWRHLNNREQAMADIDAAHSAAKTADTRAIVMSLKRDLAESPAHDLRSAENKKQDEERQRKRHGKPEQPSEPSATPSSVVVDTTIDTAAATAATTDASGAASPASAENNSATKPPA